MGTKPSVEALFERYHARIYRYFRQVTSQHEEAQDLMQELFLRLLRGWRTYEASGRETEWVFRAARNLALDYRRKRRAAIPVESLDLAVAAASDAQQLAAFGVSEALGLLPDADRDLVVLREVTGLTYLELSVICEATPAAVSQRLCRIRRRLRDLLGSRLRADQSKRDKQDG
jgi:RNA polymerase sigma factor (sigma-70 family)